MSQIKKQILVAGEESFIRFMSVLLARLGFEIISAKETADALNFAKSFKPDIIIFDLDMLATKGADVLSKIKQDKAISEIPAIMISGGEGDRLKKLCVSQGFTRFLAKPIDLSELNKTIQTIFRPQGWMRKHLRSNYDARVTIIHEGTERVYQAKTISEHGMFVAASAPLRVGTEVGVKLRIDGKTISTTARVIYIQPPGMAIEFGELAPDDQKELTHFVSDLLAGDIATLK